MSAVLERTYALPPYGELRLSTTSSTAVTVTLETAAGLDGAGEAAPRADVNGTELLPGAAVHLPPSRSFRVFSATGGRVRVSAAPPVLQRAYATTSGATWVRSLLDLHTDLEAARVEARRLVSVGPRVLVVSDRHGAGTSTYALLLAQYAVRLGYHPLLLDAAVGHPRWGYPGCLSLFQWQYTMDVEEETTYMPGVHVLAATTRTVGRPHAELYLHALRHVLRAGTAKMAGSDRCRVGGWFLDYGVVSPAEILQADAEEAAGPAAPPGGRLPPHPLDTLLDVCQAADVTEVVVVQSAWLRARLAQRAQRRLAATTPPAAAAAAAAGRTSTTTPTPPTTAVVVAGEGLCFRLRLVDALEVVVPPAEEPARRRQRWLSYFFGTATSPVRPTLWNVDVAQVRLVLLGGSDSSAMATLMPMRDDDETDAPHADADGRHAGPLPIAFLTTQDVDLRGRLVAISTATEFEVRPDGSLQRLPLAEWEGQLRAGAIAGFALVESVGPEKMTLLVNDAPMRRDLGLCLLLTGESLTREG